MGRQIGVFVVWLAVALAAAQQGGFGGGGFGGGGAAQGGGQGQGQDQDGGTEPRQVGPYLSHRETASILTPGEYVEWELDLKKGQVVIAEARSEAFDPAMEIVEGEKVLIDNDDRFAGDQRPLLIWHCDKDGKYLLRARSFKGRAGGQMLSRHAVYDCVTLGLGVTEHPREGASHLMYRVRLQAGDFVQARFKVGESQSVPINFVRISPIGLAYVDIAEGLGSATLGTLLAPVDGDYYFWLDQHRLPGTANGAPVQVLLERVVVEPVRSVPSDVSHANNQLGVWSLSLKQGDFVEVSTDFESVNRELMFEVAPDFKKYSLTEPGKNPFVRRRDDGEERPPYLEKDTRGQGRSSRGIFVLHDSTIWIATATNGYVRGPMKIRITPAARDLTLAGSSSHLRLNHIQFWGFDANPGDVIKLKANVEGFAANFEILDPQNQIRRTGFTDREPGQSEMFFVARSKGRHYISVACRGHGGTGTYTIERTIVSPTELVPGKPVEGQLAEGEVRVIVLTLDPQKPKLLKTAMWSLQRQVTDPLGQQANMQFFAVNVFEYGYAYVREPTTLMLVVSGGAGSYHFSLVDPPQPESDSLGIR